MNKQNITRWCALVAVCTLTLPAFAQTCTVKSITVSGAAGTSAHGVKKYDTVVGTYLDWHTGSLTNRAPIRTWIIREEARPR